jgi:hypothetical protein
MEAITRRQLFVVGETAYSWEDVRRHAVLTGDWAALEGAARAGLACVKNAAETGETVPREEISAAARAFRYGRDLLAADDLKLWLARWQLDNQDWLAYLGRTVLRERWAEQVAAIVERHPVDPSETEAVIWPEGACSGAFDNFGRKLAERAAVGARLGVDSGDVAALEDAFEQFCAEAPDRRRLEREIESNRLDWQRVTVDLLRVEDENVAREAALCVTSDGMALDDVARQTGAAVSRFSGPLDELDAELRAPVLGAGSGEVLGPIRVGERFAVGVVHDRVQPSADDDETRRRAEASILRRTVVREVNDRVRWLNG